MPLFRLGPELVFPPPELAEPNGLLAVGGDLSPQRLLLAYALGIFPWYQDDEPILWWSPMPRCVLLPGDLNISRSLGKALRTQTTVTSDCAFAAVLYGCATCGERQQVGTWISPEMQRAYTQLHALGHAHSVEVWDGEALVGGLYGVALGRCFFGESMFHRRSNASKVALVRLATALFAAGYVMIDMQLPTPHLLSLGGRLVERPVFNACLRSGGVTSAPVRPAEFPKIGCGEGNGVVLKN